MLKKVLKYVEQNYSSPISIETAAEVTNYSPSYFMRFFKSNMGISFTSYLIDYRLSMASRYLTTSNDSILEIAAKCGFDNISYFNRQFRTKYGMTPTEYRKKHAMLAYQIYYKRYCGWSS
ncbi:MAG: AraC family transcriptional regulator [Clostridiales bacterium]|nr:AraC family transcriptional regulator [Clostridiales bacterium]